MLQATRFTPLHGTFSNRLDICAQSAERYERYGTNVPNTCVQTGCCSHCSMLGQHSHPSAISQSRHHHDVVCFSRIFTHLPAHYYNAVGLCRCQNVLLWFRGLVFCVCYLLLCCILTRKTKYCNSTPSASTPLLLSHWSPPPQPRCAPIAFVAVSTEHSTATETRAAATDATVETAEALLQLLSVSLRCGNVSATVVVFFAANGSS